MERLIVDMDGVLADVYEQFISFDMLDHGRRKKPSEIVGIPEHEAFENGKSYVRTPGFFRNAPVIHGSQRVLEKLNKKYEIFIVSSAIEFRQSLLEKIEWLEEHFPFITWEQIVLCGSKIMIKGDIMIDDHFKNLDSFEGKTYLFTQPHNQKFNSKDHERVSSWGEIESRLLTT